MGKRYAFRNSCAFMKLPNSAVHEPGGRVQGWQNKKVSWFLGVLVLGFLVSGFLGLLFFSLLGFLVSWRQRLLVSKFRGFKVSKIVKNSLDESSGFVGARLSQNRQSVRRPSF